MLHQTDKEEALKQLEQELLEQSEPEQEEYLDPDVLEEAPAGEAPRVYRNFSNNYGKDLRNFASDYQSYHSDETEDLQQEQPEPEHFKISGALIFLMIILGAMVAFAIFLFVLLGGIL